VLRPSFSDIAEFTQNVTCDAALSVAGALAGSTAIFTGSSLTLQNSSPSLSVKTGPGTTVFSVSPSLINVTAPIISSKRATFGADGAGISVLAQGNMGALAPSSSTGAATSALTPARSP
jgi:hypothetical protein